MAIAKDKKQEQEWKMAQDINVSIDLLSATKQHLKFLEAVDRNSSWLCQDGPALQRAIYRYNACWIPLLAKHAESPFFEGPLVVPLDCEWIWHCHRLNPIAYKDDCQKSYGKILANKNVVSTTEGTSEKETEKVWEKLYPNESFVLDPSVTKNEKSENNLTEAGKFTEYDLISAVKRQSSFFSQVSEPHMSNDIYLEGAIARYKGFLHLVKRNVEMDRHNFLAPTYDVDLIWHTHQLNPVSYSNDLENLLGFVLGHDDTVQDRTKGQKLDVGFTRTINSWTDTYGVRYRRAGAMHKFSAPTPISGKDCIDSDEESKIMHLPEFRIMEVMLEFVDVKDMPEEHKGKQLFVSFSKTQPDALFIGKRMLAMHSEFEEPVANFHCQPTGKFLFELVACSPSSEEEPHPSETLGSCSISLEEILLPETGYMIEKWLELIPAPNCESTKPICLRMAISVTPSTPAPLLLSLVHDVACPSTEASTEPPCSHTVPIPSLALSDASIVSPSPDSKANLSSIPLDTVPFPCVIRSDANACVNVTGDTKSKPTVTGYNASGCFARCLVVSNACVRVNGGTSSKPSATGSNGSKCVINCVGISKANINSCATVAADTSCNASKCVINCVGISKANINSCATVAADTSCNASKCVINCVGISKANINSCARVAADTSCNASKCVSNCVMISKANVNSYARVTADTSCNASKCVSNCVMISKPNGSLCAFVTRDTGDATNSSDSDAKASNLVTGADDCETCKASLCGIDCETCKASLCGIACA